MDGSESMELVTRKAEEGQFICDRCFDHLIVHPVYKCCKTSIIASQCCVSGIGNLLLSTITNVR